LRKKIDSVCRGKKSVRFVAEKKSVRFVAEKKSVCARKNLFGSCAEKILFDSSRKKIGLLKNEIKNDRLTQIKIKRGHHDKEK
jgi:hypothetical protein